MPLIKSGSKKAFSKNVGELISTDKKTEGSCPFCNPDSKFYNYKWILKNP